MDDLLERERALLREAVRRQRVLSEISRILLDYTGDDDIEPLRRIVPVVVEALGDWCAFSLIQPDGKLKNVAHYHPDPRQRDLAKRVEEMMPAQRWDAGPPEANVLVQKKPIYYAKITDEMLKAGLPSQELYDVYKEIDLSSLIIAPLIVGSEPTGTLVLASIGAEGRKYSEHDVDFVFSLAGRAAMAVRNARLVRAVNHERREAELRAAELLAILESDPNGVVIYGPDDRLRFASPSLDRMLGFPFSEQTGKHFRELFGDPTVPVAAGDRETRIRETEQLFADQTITVRENLELPGPPPRSLLRSSTPVRSPGGDYLGRLFVFVDLTQERQLDRQRADFLTVAAHEMRTPLTPLSMYLQTLERRLQRGQPFDPDTLRKARRQVGRMEKLVQDLLDVSRLEAGRVELRKGPVAVDELVGEVVDDFRGSARHHELVIERPETRLVVDADRERLEQVVVNLMTNAIKYSPDGGRIDVRIFREGNDAVVSVSDEGIGIPAEEQQRLFQRFFRARNAATSNYGGLGIGLYVSHEIVERHGGRFDVDSVMGKGTTFSFRLPLLSEATRVERDKPRILLVDDDPDILEATAGFLEDEGFDVQQARDGITALEMVRAAPPDLMLLDLMMPVLDGWAFVERLRNERLAPGVPLVVFSADRDVRQKAASLHADAVLRKPFSLDELHELVGRLLNGAERATAP